MKKIDSLNLIPFIDVMLVLLVIILTSASFVMRSQIQVDVPRLEETEGSNQQKQSHRITIDKEGHFYLDDKPLSLGELKAQVSSFDKDSQIIITSDRQSDLEFFLEVTTILRDMGIYDVYVTTEKK